MTCPAQQMSESEEMYPAHFVEVDVNRMIVRFFLFDDYISQRCNRRRNFRTFLALEKDSVQLSAIRKKGWLPELGMALIPSLVVLNTSSRRNEIKSFKWTFVNNSDINYVSMLSILCASGKNFQKEFFTSLVFSRNRKLTEQRMGSSLSNMQYDSLRSNRKLHHTSGKKW